MRKISQILEELQTSLNTYIVDWFRETHPGSNLVDELSVDATFQGVYDRLNGKTALSDGDDAVYSYINIYNTKIAEEVLKKLSELVNIPYDDLNDLWKNQYKTDENTIVV